MGACGSSNAPIVTFDSDEDWIVAGDDIPPDNKFPESFGGYETKEKLKLPCTNNSDKSECDVFYVHNKSLIGLSGNSLENLRREIECHVSIFNNCCKLYSPNYRHGKSMADINGIEIAYEDIKKSFLYYLKNWNNNRPFFLAGQGQGSYLLVRLIQDIFLDIEKMQERSKDLRNRLVAAYLPGTPIYEIDINKKSLLKVSSVSRDTGSIISWCTTYTNNGNPVNYFYPGKEERNWNSDENKNDNDTTAIIVNPISWDNDTSGSFKENSGSMNNDGMLQPRICGAKFTNEYQTIFVTKESKDYSCYKNSDYMPYWMNIRTNCALRLNVWKNSQLM